VRPATKPSSDDLGTNQPEPLPPATSSTPSRPTRSSTSGGAPRRNVTPSPPSSARLERLRRSKAQHRLPWRPHYETTSHKPTPATADLTADLTGLEDTELADYCTTVLLPHITGEVSTAGEILDDLARDITALAARRAAKAEEFDAGQMHRARRAAGYTIDQAAELAGISPAHWHRIEAGDRHPSPELADRLRERFQEIPTTTSRSTRQRGTLEPCPPETPKTRRPK
jgi:DNA-binding XRE family transcriptional regulator